MNRRKIARLREGIKSGKRYKKNGDVIHLSKEMIRKMAIELDALLAKGRMTLLYKAKEAVRKWNPQKKEMEVIGWTGQGPAKALYGYKKVTYVPQSEFDSNHQKDKR